MAKSRQRITLDQKTFGFSKLQNATVRSWRATISSTLQLENAIRREIQYIYEAGDRTQSGPLRITDDEGKFTSYIISNLYDLINDRLSLSAPQVPQNEMRLRLGSPSLFSMPLRWDSLCVDLNSNPWESIPLRTLMLIETYRVMCKNQIAPLPTPRMLSDGYQPQVWITIPGIVFTCFKLHIPINVDSGGKADSGVDSNKVNTGADNDADASHSDAGNRNLTSDS